MSHRLPPHRTGRFDGPDDVSLVGQGVGVIAGPRPDVGDESADQSADDPRIGTPGALVIFADGIKESFPYAPAD